MGQPLKGRRLAPRTLRGANTSVGLTPPRASLPVVGPPMVLAALRPGGPRVAARLKRSAGPVRPSLLLRGRVAASTEGAGRGATPLRAPALDAIGGGPTRLALRHKTRTGLRPVAGVVGA